MVHHCLFLKFDNNDFERLAAKIFFDVFRLTHVVRVSRALKRLDDQNPVVETVLMAFCRIRYGTLRGLSFGSRDHCVIAARRIIPPELHLVPFDDFCCINGDRPIRREINHRRGG